MVQTESDFLSPDLVSAGANVVKNGPQNPDVVAEGKKKLRLLPKVDK